jgi:TPR repeat protein
MYEKGWGVERDVQRAMALYQQICETGVAIACRNVGRLYEGDAGFPPDPERSAVAYRRTIDLALAACDRGVAEGCASAGYLFEDGKGVPKDEGRGRALTAKACSMGYSWTCNPRESD